MQTFARSSLVVVMAACSSPAATAPEPDAGSPEARPQRYHHPLPDCPADEPTVNCAPSVEVCAATGKAYMLVTDIVNAGTFVDDGAQVRFHFPVADVPRSQVFTRQPDGSLIDDWVGWTWTAVAETEHSLCE